MRGSPWLWVAAGLVLRCLWPEGFLFRQDEAGHLADSFAVSRGGEWPAHAWHSSAGVPNGPGYLYFLAAITSVTSDPRAAQGAIVLLNVAALALSVPLFRRWFREPRDATIAVALYATSPVAIWFSRKIWDPCLLPILAVAALLLATKTLETRGSRAPAALLPLLAAAAMVHQSAIFFGIVLGVVVLPGLLRAHRGAVASGAVAGLAIVLPYGAWFVGALGRGEVAAAPGSPLPDIDVLTNFLLDATGHNILQTAGLAAGGVLMWPFPPAGLLVYLAMVPFAATFVAGCVRIARGATAEDLAGPARRILVAVALGLPAFYLLARVRGAAHHYLVAWPVLFALLVLGAKRLAASRHRALRFARRLPVLVALQSAAWIGFQSYMSAHRGSPSYGLPYQDLRAACAEVAAAAEARGLGTADAPLVLAVDVPRDRGPLPHQFAYELTHRRQVTVRAPEPGESPHLVLRVTWAAEPFPQSFGRGSWEVQEGS